MRNRLFSLALLLLLILGIGLFVYPQKDSSSLENRPLKTNSDFEVNNILNTSEEIMKDQFYLRDYMNKAYKKLDILFNKPFSKSFIGNVEVKTLAEDVLDLGDGYLINALVEYNDDNLLLASQRGYNVNEMDLMFEDIKTYVYFPTRIEELLSNNEALFRDKFVQQLNGNITYDYLKINGVDDHKNYYYKSDMHWNNRGAYQGYKDIIEMISKDFNLDEVKVPLDEITYPYEFKGNVASQIAGASDSDYISDYIFDLGDYKYYINGEEKDFNEVKNLYKDNGNTSTYSDYEYYFGDNAYLREFDFNQNDKPNILIFSDSYINTNLSWIASHFNKTVIVDLRAKDDSFSIEEIVKNNDIDIILVTMRYTNLYLNGNMFIPLS